MGRGHQSDIAIDEVKMEKCGPGGGDGCRFLYFYLVLKVMLCCKLSHKILIWPISTKCNRVTPIETSGTNMLTIIDVM